MRLEKLINEDTPFCLYCQSRCNLESLGKISSVKMPYVCCVMDKFVCQQCGESFEIYFEMDEEGQDLEHSAFGITCQNIFVYQDYQSDKTRLSLMIKNNTEQPEAHFIDVPQFVLQFSDKKLLHKKLKTYLTFS